jgi:hypothetical protein
MTEGGKSRESWQRCGKKAQHQTETGKYGPISELRQKPGARAKRRLGSHGFIIFKG